MVNLARRAAAHPDVALASDIALALECNPALNMDTAADTIHIVPPPEVVSCSTCETSMPNDVLQPTAVTLDLNSSISDNRFRFDSCSDNCSKYADYNLMVNEFAHFVSSKSTCETSNSWNLLEEEVRPAPPSGEINNVHVHDPWKRSVKKLGFQKPSSEQNSVESSSKSSDNSWLKCNADKTVLNTSANVLHGKSPHSRRADTEVTNRSMCMNTPSRLRPS